MELLQIAINFVFRYLSYSYNILGYEVSLLQICFVAVLLGAVGLMWHSFKQ